MKSISGAIRYKLNAWMLSRHSFQKRHWEEELRAYAENDHDQLYGFDWGDPESSQDRLGNYLHVKELLLEKINSNTIVLEIGSLGGKWTKYMRKAKKIIAVDINKYFVEYLRKRMQTDNIEFYISKGNELKGISDSSVDLVFSMDTLVRVKSSYIRAYFREIGRVLKQGGEVILHLPNNDLPFSKSKGFTNLNTKAIESLARKTFRHYILDSSTLIHGTLVIATK